MSYNFETIDNKVLTSTNKVDIPDWIDKIAFKEKVEPQFDLESNKDIINQRHVIASRTDNNLAFIRDIKYTFNDKTLKSYAVVKLSSFLRNKRYSINSTEIKNDGISLDVTFEGNPANYKFTYFEKDGQIQNNKMFTASLNDEINEYPFSNAGLEDSFEDAKNNFDKKKSYQVKKANQQFTVMTKYEIVKRCNNSLEKASELINKNLKEGNIVGVGSNEFASYYDMNYLFPDLREEYKSQQSHTAEFVDNEGQSKGNEHKTAERLAIEASKILSNDFTISKIISQKRNKDSFIVTAEIVNDNIRHTADFVFNIINEKLNANKIIVNNVSYSFDGYKKAFKNDKKIASYTKRETKSIYKNIFSTRSLVDELKSVINENHIKDLIADWQKKGFIQQLETQKFASQYSLNELLDKSDVTFLDEDEIKSIIAQQQRFGNNSKFYKNAVQDNDTRMKIALYEQEQKLNDIAEFIGKYFDNFNLDMLSNDDIIIMFMINEKPNNIYAKVDYKDDKISNIICKIGSKKLSIDEASKIFEKSNLLKSYLNDNDMSNHYNIVISKSMIHEKLKDYLAPQTIDNIIQNLINKKELKQIASNKYVSSNNFEYLINLCDDIPLQNLKNENLKLSDKTSNLKFEKIALQDNDSRNAAIVKSLEDYAYQVNKYITAYVDHYSINLLDKHHAKLNLCGKEIDAYIISDDKIDDVVCEINGKKISISKLQNALKKSELLQAYLNDNDESKYQGFIITRRAFNEKLKDYISPQQISALIGYLEENHQIKKIASDKYVSKITFDELIKDVNVAPDITIKEKNLKLANKSEKYYFDLMLTDDNDTRLGLNDKNLVPVREVFAKLIENNNIVDIKDLSKLFNEWEKQKLLSREKAEKIVSKINFDKMIKNTVFYANSRKENISLSKRIQNIFERNDFQDGDTRNNTAISEMHKIESAIKDYIKEKFNCEVKILSKYDVLLKFKNKKIYAKIEYVDNVPNNVVCKVGNKSVSIDKLIQTFAKSNILKSYLKDNDESIHNNIIISKSNIYQKLGNYLSKDDIDDFIKQLTAKKMLQVIDSSSFASDNNFDELLNHCGFEANEDLKKKNLKQAQKNQNIFERNDYQDGDIRNPEEKFTVANCKKQILDILPQYITVKTIKNISLQDEQVSAELSLFNTKKGVSSNVLITANVKNAEINQIKYFVNDKEINLDDAFNTNVLIDKLNQSQEKISQKSIMFTKQELIDKLRYLTNEKQILDVIENWKRANKISEVGLNKYASHYSLNDLLAMSNIKSYKDDVIEQKFNQAKRQKDIIPKSYHTSNFEAKTLTSVLDGKTNDKFNESKTKVLSLANDYLNKQIITANKLNKIKQLIENVKTASQLDLIYKDLKRYSL